MALALRSAVAVLIPPAAACDGSHCQVTHDARETERSTDQPLTRKYSPPTATASPVRKRARQLAFPQRRSSPPTPITSSPNPTRPSPTQFMTSPAPTRRAPPPPLSPT